LVLLSYAHGHATVILGRLLKMATREWYLSSSSIKGLLLDITGVLYNSGEGGGVPIKGSIDAIARWLF